MIVAVIFGYISVIIAVGISVIAISVIATVTDLQQRTTVTAMITAEVAETRSIQCRRTRIRRPATFTILEIMDAEVVAAAATKL